MRVLIAFDKFKDSMSAKIACTMAANALAETQPDWEVYGTPLTDGGEGFCEILTESAGGRFDTLTVPGPVFRDVQAPIGRVSLERLSPSVRRMLAVPDTGTLAIVEMAQASGLEKLSPRERNCLKTSSIGTGVLLGAAADLGADAILLGVGGSATSDLGGGALEALGIRFHDGQGRECREMVPQDWQKVAAVSGTVLSPSGRPLPPIRIACDVDNPLFGPRGAAAVFGPQKGLTTKDLPFLESEGERLAGLLCRHFSKADSLALKPGSGAAGGITFGLMAACDARLVPGFSLLTEFLALEERIRQADIMITGEGSFDASSLHGKGPYAVLQMARSQEKQRAHVFAGKLEEDAVGAIRAWFGVFSADSIARKDLSLEENLLSGPEALYNTIRKRFSS